MDFAPEAVLPASVATSAGVDAPRPIQIETVTVDGRHCARVWFITTSVTIVISPLLRGGKPPVVTRDGAVITITTADGSVERITLSTLPGPHPATG